MVYSVHFGRDDIVLSKYNYHKINLFILVLRNIYSHIILPHINRFIICQFVSKGKIFLMVTKKKV